MRRQASSGLTTTVKQAVSKMDDNTSVIVAFTSFLLLVAIAIIAGALYSAQVTRQVTIREKACVSSGQQWSKGNCVKTVQP